LVWSAARLLCVASGVFDVYPAILIKAALVFHVLMTVQDSIETRPMVLHREELRRRRDEKLGLESALFWKFLLPRPIWRLLGYEAVVEKATHPAKQPPKPVPNTDDDKPKPKKTKQEKLLKKVRITKNLVSGTRETAVEDLIWGALQIAYVVLDLTEKQAIGTAFLVYLCTLLEDVLSSVVVVPTAATATANASGGGGGGDTPPKKKIRWIRISWILLCLYLNGTWFLSPS
jgi:hypothetical protein